MGSEWTGFTDEELTRLHTSHDDGKKKSSVRPKSQQSSRPKNRPQRAVPPMQKTIRHLESIEESARLSTRLTTSTTDQQSASRNESTLSAPKVPSSFNLPEKPSEDVTTRATDDEVISTVGNDKSSDLLSDADGLNRDMTNLGQYQQQQKMMEELNKQKKKMLTNALALRQKAASKEAIKLKTLNSELSKLDQSLNFDVSVIRDRIEEATREYAEASKRYGAAEQEYIAAKINLHKKSDKKEQLTEHLYAIIHQNELRKAKKLAELMQQLELVSEDTTDGVDNLPQLPSLSFLGNVQTVASGNLKQVASPEAPTHPEANKPMITSENSVPRTSESESQMKTTNSEISAEASVGNETSEASVGNETSEASIDNETSAPSAAPDSPDSAPPESSLLSK